MATEKELQKQLREVKKEVRELREHNKFLLDRLEKAHERNAEIRKQMMTMTFEDVIKTQKELADYQEKIKNFYRFSATRHMSNDGTIAKMTPDTLDLI